LVAAFDFRRQFVLDGIHAEYDRIDALKLSQCNVRSWEREFRLTSHRTAAVARPVKYRLKASIPATDGYFAWGCFRYFWREPRRPGVTAEHPA
jgi:hypothetical protein